MTSGGVSKATYMHEINVSWKLPVRATSIKLVLTSLCSCWSCKKKSLKLGLPKWVIERRPVKRLRLEIFWKYLSQMY